jgi:CheY-like chemotaxis protein
MTIEYNILWFEDIKSSFDAKKQIVKDIVEEFGFQFPEPRNEVNGDNINSIDYSIYDLLIVDLNLAGTKGTNLIDRIRNQQDVYTEVIFYSSDGEGAVRAALHEFQIDGAYCAARDNDEFEDKVRKVIKTTIKKVQDINNMRGLLMAETSDIDFTMLKIIKLIMEKNVFSIRDGLIQRIFESVGSKVNGKKDDYEKFLRTGNINQVIKDNLMFDASQKLIAVQYIIDKMDHKIAGAHKNGVFSTEYTKVKQQRDLLAHVVEEYVAGKKVLKSGNKELEFTDDFCKEMRLKLRVHSENLNDIYKAIDESGAGETVSAVKPSR